MDIKPIKTDADYRAALNEIESLMMAGPDTPEGEKLDVMVTLIEAYEAKHFRWICLILLRQSSSKWNARA